jgi:hypothetical protein
MKRFILALSATVISSCACPSFVKGVNAGLSQIGPEYKAYVQADPNLDEDSKKIRLRTLVELMHLLEEAKK